MNENAMTPRIIILSKQFILNMALELTSISYSSSSYLSVIKMLRMNISHKKKRNYLFFFFLNLWYIASNMKRYISIQLGGKNRLVFKNILLFAHYNDLRISAVKIQIHRFAFVCWSYISRCVAIADPIQLIWCLILCESFRMEHIYALTQPVIRSR